jgi:HK97 family phage major capsid protein
MAVSMTIEERQARITEIRARQEELDTEFRGMTFTDDARAEFEQLAAERKEHDDAIEELEQRASYLGEQAFQTRKSGVARGDDIWDLTTIRSSVGNPEEARVELHDRAKRALEVAHFADDRVRHEDAQGHVARLLQRDTKDGELGRLILQTGSPAYRRAFGKYVGGQPLSADEQRAFSLGTTGIPIPYTLDPTVIPVSNSVVNPLRAISSVEQVVGVNEWRGLTAAAITAARASEATEASDNTPTLAQPAIVCSKVQAFVPFSIESGQDWSGLEGAVVAAVRGREGRRGGDGVR